MGVPLADGGHRLVRGHGLVAPHEAARRGVTSELLRPHARHPPAAAAPPPADPRAAVQVGVGRYEAEDVLQNLIGKDFYTDIRVTVTAARLICCCWQTWIGVFGPGT